jgi:SnoaL-like protein
MPEPKTTNTDEAVVRHYLAAISAGNVLDALSAFSMDARMRDEGGRERNGIREIAAAFASQGHPVRVEVEEVQREGETVAVRMRMTFPEGSAPKEYRSVFRVSRERIHSLVMDPVPMRRVRRGGLGHSV